ncbi:FtsK/SpoIIIE domain-containing protein, partial [Streptomyces pathocidini]|uniref:FtsK/SpoIIIE domain-containing protein n=1 Tax=Streptomyces pathocidini TaxID=1650571 RepID=UPI00340336B6
TDPAPGPLSGPSGPVVLYAGGERLDPQRCALGEPPLTDGAVLSLGGPADPGRHPGVPQEAPSDASAQLHVVAGPDSGGVHLLHGGQIRVGRSADADVPLDDPDVSRLHCAVTVSGDGRVTIADLGSTNGTTLDGRPLDSAPAPFTPGALLRVGESTLRLVDPGSRPPGGRGPSGPGGSPGPDGLPDTGSPSGARRPLPETLPTTPDGEGHLRVALSGQPPLESGPAADAAAPGERGRVASHGRAAGRAQSTWARGTTGSAAPYDRAAPAATGPDAGSTRAPSGGAPRSPGSTAPYDRAAHPDPAATGPEAGPAPAPSGRVPGTSGSAAPYDWASHGDQFGSGPNTGPVYASSGEAAADTRRPAPTVGRQRTSPENAAGAPAARAAVPAGASRAGEARVATAHRPAPTAHTLGTAQTPDARRAPDTALPTASHATPQGQDHGGAWLPARHGRPEATARWEDGHTRPAATAGGARGRTDGGWQEAGRGADTHEGIPRPALGDERAASAADGPNRPRAGSGSDNPPPRAGAASGGSDGPAGPDDATAPHRPTRRARGIGAWARRLTGGRGDTPEGLQDGGDARVGQGAAGRAPGRTPGSGGVVHERWPDPAEVLLTALGPGPRLWERGPGHPDAFTVRLGTADRPGAPATPVTVGLRETGSLGLAGPRARLSGLARSVVAQLAALHSPADLEIVLISTDRARPQAERLAEWSWLGWLPQLRPAHGQDCRLLLAYDREQATARTAELVRRLDDGPLGAGWVTADRAAVAAEAARYEGPRTLVIVDGDPGSAALRGTAARLAAGGPVAGVHLLCLAEAPAASPASPLTATFDAACTASPPFPECGTAALFTGDVATALRVMPLGPSGPLNKGVVATVDAVSAAWAERFARALAPLRPAHTGAPAAGGRRTVAPLPRTARLLDELGLARATPASLMARWAAAGDGGQEADGGRLSAVLGAGPHGPLAVDPAADGPHLLVEGGPGTGKTELLRSLAASLAAADRPDRVSLALVDGGGTERGEGLRACTDLPHVSTYLVASDPVRMREFAQALSTELKRRAELLGGLDFVGWHRQRTVAARLVAPRRSGEYEDGGPGQAARPHRNRGDLETSAVRSSPGGALKVRAAESVAGAPVLPRLVVLVDDFDALVAPALGSTGRPAAGSVVRALEAVARDGARLGVHLIAASGRPDRTSETAAAGQAGLRVTLDLLPAPAETPGGDTDGGPGGGTGEATAGRGRLVRADGSATPFQAGRVTGRIPRTATLRPTVVPLDWARMGDPPTRRPLRELGNGPTDLALLASALQRAATQIGVGVVPSLL